MINPQAALAECDDVYVALGGGTDIMELRIYPAEALELVAEHPMQWVVVYYPDLNEADLEPRAKGEPRVRVEERRLND